VLDLANKGYKKALAEDPHLCKGLNVFRGNITYEAVARELGHAYVPANEAVGF
jgi:alanine dehydrogenase